MAVPRLLVRKIGLTEIKTSLRTTDRAIANVRCRLLSNAVDALLLAAKLNVDTSPETLRTLIRRCFQRYLVDADAQLTSQALPTSKAATLDELQADISTYKEAMLQNGFPPWVALELAAIMRDGKLPSTELSAADQQKLIEGIYRAQIEATRYRISRLTADFAQFPADPLFSGIDVWAPARNHLEALPGKANSTPTQALQLSEAVERYIAFKKGKAWVHKTFLDNKRVLSLFLELSGASRLLCDVTAEEVRGFRDAMLKLPASYMKVKAFSGQPVVQLLAQDNPGKPLAPKTAAKYFHNLRAFLKWCCDEGYLDSVPGTGIKIASGSKTDSKDARYPFSAEQLQKLFASPQYTGHQSPSRRSSPGDMVIRDGNFWVPLIGLFSGMRLGEIVQLLLVDVAAESGHWYFNVDEREGEEKHFKTASSRRKVPVHPQLIEIGLLDYHAECQAKAISDRLFPDIEHGKDGYASHNFSKSFGRYLKQVGVKTLKTSFHSFRHNFKDALEAAGVEESRRRALMGHSDGSTHAGYGSRLPILVLAVDLQKISYPVDLSTLSKGTGPA